MEQPLIHQYDPETGQETVREMTQEERAAWDKQQNETPHWIGDHRE